MIANTLITVTNVDKMKFKHTIRGFSNYLFAKGGYVIRKQYKTPHKHYKEARLVSFDKNDRIYLWNDKGKKERLSKRVLKGLLIPINPIEINLSSKINLTPF